MSHPNRSVLRRFVVLSGITLLAAGCLDRPVAPATPHTTNIFVDAVTQTFVDKIDLLFLIDNSRSMADKQAILKEAVPVLVERLVTPRCLDPKGNAVGMLNVNGECTAGEPEFIPMKDIHIGVITSSLGSHGGEKCRPEDAKPGETPDDRAELLPAVRPGTALNTWNGSGFLAWDPGQDKNLPPGETNLDTLVTNFGAQVQAAGELGCGFESSLEAWYRFLIDPEPPESISIGTNVNVKGPVNQPLLDQRQAFLRPDSLLAIVMLTDENDCSIDDEEGHQGFFVSSPSLQMPRASSECTQNPNDRCCHTCAIPAPAGCPANETDSECSQKPPDARHATVAKKDDSANLRCFDHKRRFGLDFLYPTQRYVDALTKHTVRNRAGIEVPNPIFAAPAGRSPRPDNQVILAGIVGVPWQDIATDASREGTGLEYLDAEGLSTTGRWDLILGDPANNVPATDPFMRESVGPRSGENPLLHVAIVPPAETNPEANPINGHEQNVPLLDDLQYACTFKLPAPHDCTAANRETCDCNADEQANSRPLCDYPNGPTTDGIQRYAKAYPGVRHLEVLKGLKSNAIVASICPKNMAPAPGLERPSDPNYGYNPAVASILEVFSTRIGGQCLPRKLAPDTDPASDTFGQVPCNVIEAVLDDDGQCTCDASTGRSPVDSSDVRRAVREELAARKKCGTDTDVACSAYCQCQVKQLEGAELAQCQTGSTDRNLYGYCYIDEDQGIGNPALVSKCAPTQRRLLHWSGEGLPANGATMMMACFGATL